MHRAKDWLDQAYADLSAAKDSKKTAHYEWTCFQAQQAAKKALKSILLYFNVDSWGHSLVHLLRQLQQEVKTARVHFPNLQQALTPQLLEQAQELDRHYIQPRYPNGFVSGYPAEYYNPTIAQKCVEYAESFIELAQRVFKELSSS